MKHSILKEELDEVNRELSIWHLPLSLFFPKLRILYYELPFLKVCECLEGAYLPAHRIPNATLTSALNYLLFRNKCSPSPVS